MKLNQVKKSNIITNNENSSKGGLVSQMLMNTPLMQKRANEHQAIFGKTIQKQENNTGLPNNLKSGMETLSGMSLDHVKVHYNSSKPASVQAHAFAQGSDIHIASGQEKHLPHELGHIVQQAEGRVKPTTNIGGVAVNDNPSLESEATKMGEKALQMKNKSTIQQFGNSSVKNENNVQLSLKNKSKIIQKKFIDYGGLKLSELTPESINMTGSLYEILWKSLNKSKTFIVASAYDGQSSYDSKTKTLYFKKAIVDDLIEGKVDNATKVSHIAVLTHEMSHAHDHIIMGRELTGGDNKNEHTKRVLETEIRAWAAEAYSAIEAEKRVHAMDKEKGKLIDGWENYKRSMLQDVAKNKATNHLIGRVWKYIKTNIKPLDTSEIQQWAKDNEKFIDEQIMEHRDVIVGLLEGKKIDYGPVLEEALSKVD